MNRKQIRSHIKRHVLDHVNRIIGAVLSDKYTWLKTADNNYLRDQDNDTILIKVE